MRSLSVLFALAVFSASAAAQQLPAGHPGVSSKTAGNINSVAQLPQKAKVLSTLDAPGYTYMEVTQGKETLWLAGTTVAVKKGDVVRYAVSMVMKNFRSKSLNRTFPSVTFVDPVVVTNEKE